MKNSQVVASKNVAINTVLKPLTQAVLIAMCCNATATLADTDIKKEVPFVERVVKIDPILERQAQKRSVLSVIIVFGEQPQREIARRLNARYEPEIDALAAKVRAIYDRYLTRDSIASKDEEIKHSELLAQYVNKTDRAEILALNKEREQLVRQLRQRIAKQSAAAIRKSQEPYIDLLQSYGVKVQQRLVTLNAVGAKIPANILKEIASIDGVAEVVYNRPGKPELSNQASSLGAPSWWATGFDGGIWDVGVLDSGVLETHDALKSHTFYENYAPNGNHGTGVACMYGSTNNTNKGLAFGLNSIIVDNAGNEATSMAGADWMLRSAGDDPEVINYSWGNGAATGSDWHAFSRFVDAVVYDYNTNWAKSAGNNGFGTNTMTVPANNYNGLTVANMWDNNTVSRSDDVIWGTSSRGPTVLNRKKPDLVAPGNQTMTCNNSGGYSNLGGTSSAAPKVGAGTLLLTDAGNWDPRSIKAVLINTADSWEDNNTQTTADDGAKVGKEWNKTYGWGYLDLGHAHFHRNDYFTGSVKPKGQSGDYKLYKGHMYKGDKATLVWERDVDYNNAATPTSYRSLSDLDLKLYAKNSNALLDSDTTIRDNVHQVAASASQPVVVKVYAYSSSFDGASRENFTLATEENFSPATGPQLTTSVATASRILRNSIFVYRVTVRNSGDLDAHDLKVRLKLPRGFSLVSGAANRSLRTLADGTSRTFSWKIRAPLFAPATSRIRVLTSSNSYGEQFNTAATKKIAVY